MKEFVLSAPQAPKLNINYEAELNAEQLPVVMDGDGPCLVLAGAGSGKTRTVTYRVAWLLEHGVPPEQILLLTFTNKAAKEMIMRVERLLKTYPQGLWSGTFHSVANRLLRQYGNRTEFGSGFSILDEDDATDLMKLCIKEQKVSDMGKRFPSSAVLKSISSYAANARIPLDEAIERKNSDFSSFTFEITEILKRYERNKIEQRSMDFDDLLLVLLKLLQEQPDVREQLSSKFAYVIVDEFQDTNLIQAEIVKLLSGKHKNLLVVGDDAQSIYSFRAAEIKNILNFPDQYSGAKVFRLVTNYRSTPEILHVANEVIKNNEEQFSKELVAVSKAGELPVVVPAADQRQEAQYVAEQVVELINTGTPLPEIAVLFRAAFHSQAVEFELMKRNIPYDYRGGLKFFERAHVKDSIAHLRILRNVKDSMAWIRALQIHPGVGLATAAKIAGHAAIFESARAAVDSSPRLGAKALLGWQRCTKILSAMLSADGPAAALRNFAGSESYKEYLEAEYPNFRDRLDDLEQFGLFAEQYEDIGMFLDAVTLTGDFGVKLMDTEQQQMPSAAEDKMVLSTIHQAKGLEWDNVFIINLAEGAFPHTRSYGSSAEMAEERRLFYVASTRARKKLFFTYPITSGYENVEIRQPSTFLDEIPKAAIETIRLRAALPSWAQPNYGSGSNRYPSKTVRENWGNDDEPTIVLDANGERLAKPMPSSFLRDVDEL
ncbi:MAG: ATP-dependent helicase [Patescibacteria group bacterium]